MNINRYDRTYRNVILVTNHRHLITGICSQCYISILVLSVSDICGDMFVVDDTVCEGDTILHRGNKRAVSLGR
jgi:hypothetical protein